jgi:hypothetical protein
MNEMKDWVTTFGVIVAKPFPATFIAEAEKAKGKFNSAVAWVALVAVILEVNYLIALGHFSLSRILKAVLFVPIVFIFSVFCIHMFYQRFFGRKKDYHEELLYLIVGIFVPFTLAATFVAYIPRIGEFLSWMAVGYAIILTVIAVKAITKLKVWQSAIVVFSGLVVAIIGYFVIPILIFGVMSSTRRF